MRRLFQCVHRCSTQALLVTLQMPNNSLILPTFTTASIPPMWTGELPSVIAAGTQWWAVYCCCQLLILCGITDRWVNDYRELVEWFWGENQTKILRKTNLSSTVSTTNLTWTHHDHTTIFQRWCTTHISTQGQAFLNTKYPRHWTTQPAQNHGPVFPQDLAPSAYNPLMSTDVHELCQPPQEAKTVDLRHTRANME